MRPNQAQLQENNGFNIVFRRIVEKNIGGNTKATIFIHSMLLTIGLSAGIPYINPAKQFAGDNHTLGYVYAGSEFLAAGFLTTWLLKEIHDDIIYRVMLSPKINCKSISLLIFPIFLAVLTALPEVIIAYMYNEAVRYLALIAFFDAVVAKTFTFFNIIEGILNRIEGNLYHKKLKNLVLEELSVSSDNIVNSNTEAFNEYIRKVSLNTVNFAYLSSQSNCRDFYERIQCGNSPQSNKAKINNLKNIVSFILALIIPINWAPTVFILVYKHAQVVLSAKAASITLGILSSILTYLLEALFIRRIVVSVFDFSSNLLSNENKKSLALKYYPKTFIIASLLGIGIASLSFATRAMLINDLYPDGAYRDITLVSATQ